MSWKTRITMPTADLRIAVGICAVIFIGGCERQQQSTPEAEGVAPVAEAAPPTILAAQEGDWQA
ncbi:MAG: hypothetical protein IIC59_15565, partial [Proteobacteria bacterium]|nr:hypothetical protein [Pseudomonadota bacterium]